MTTGFNHGRYRPDVGHLRCKDVFLSFMLPSPADTLTRCILSWRRAFAVAFALTACIAAHLARAAEIAITNPALGVYATGIGLRARVDSASTAGVVITASPTGSLAAAGTLRLCRGQGNACERVMDVSYAAGATSVTFPTFTPRAIVQDFYYVQRVDATATTTGGLDPAMRSGSMIVMVDSPMTGQENVAQVSVAGGYACALITSGAVKCWSGGDTPQLLPGAPASVTKVALSSSSSTDFSCLLASGTVYCWGNSVGDGTSLTRSTPVAISGISGVVTDLFVGYNRACALTGTTVWCWRDYGYEIASSGQLNAPYPATLSPVAFSALGNTISDIHMNVAGACALNTAADVLCWGTNLTGNLGNATGINSRTLFPVSSVSGLKGRALAAHASLPQSHVCAVTFANDLWCWGSNSSSQLGRGTSATPSWQPAPATLVTQHVVSAVVGGDATCAIHPGGKASCWGDNSRGRLGIGGVAEYQPTGNRTGIVAAPGAMLMGDAAIAQLSVSHVKSCAALADGSVRCAGPAVTVGSTSIPSSTAFAVDGFGPKLSTYTAPTIMQATRTRDVVSLRYQDSLASGGAPITAHQWACYPQSNGNIGNAAEVVTNEASGVLHVVQGTLSTRTGPWQCKVRFRTPDGVSAWSPLVTIAANAVAVPTITSAIYDGEYGTVTWRDNNSDSAGPITPTMTYCTVQWRNAPTVQVTGCEPPNSRCILNMSGSEPANQMHVSRLPLPPATDFSSGSCRVFVDTMDGSQVSADVPLLQAASPAPTIVSGRVVGTQGVLTFTDNRTVGAGNILSAVYACTRVRDGATSSTSIAINEPANSQHTITVPLLGNNQLQDPDSYSCKVRVTPSTGTVSPDSPAFVIGANSPPVISNFAFTANNGVISGSFDISDPDGDLVKNQIVYFGSSPRSMECSTGTLGSSYDVPLAGGRVQFNASAGNVGCAALTAINGTIYGFVTAQDQNGLYATIVDAQAVNTPPVVVTPPSGTTYSIMFDAIQSTLAPGQAINISMRIVDQNGAMQSQFRGAARVTLSTSGVGFSYEDPEQPAADTITSRLVIFRDGVARLRNFKLHDDARVRIVAATRINGSNFLDPVSAVVASAKFAAYSDSAKASSLAGSTLVTGSSSFFGTAATKLVTSKLMWGSDQDAFLGLTQFLADWQSGAVRAYLRDQSDVATLLPAAGVTYVAGSRSVSFNVPPGEYELVFKRGAAEILPTRSKRIAVGTRGSADYVWIADNFPIANSQRRVIFVHGVFGSTLTSFTGSSGAAVHCGLSASNSVAGFLKLPDFSGIAPRMPASLCARSTDERDRGVWANASCDPSGFSFLCTSNVGGLWTALDTRLTSMGFRVVYAPYDWRLTPADAAREYLEAVVIRESAASGQPVDVIAHSMGGLVVLNLLLSSDFRRRIDRVVTLGTPFAGSVNAYGLMDVADPAGLDYQLSAASAPRGFYSAVAANLARDCWSSDTSKAKLFNADGSYALPQRTRRQLFQACAPSGMFLYPDKTYLPFTFGTDSAGRLVWHRPPAVVARDTFNGVDAPNQLSGLGSYAECGGIVAARTGAITIPAGEKTRISALHAKGVTTIRAVQNRNKQTVDALQSYATSFNFAFDWSNLQQPAWSTLGSMGATYWGDGTVPFDGQRERLASFLGVLSSAVSNNTCTTDISDLSASFGEHADLTRNANAINYAASRLPYPGVAVAVVQDATKALAAASMAPQLSIAADASVAVSVKHGSMPTVGVLTDGTRVDSADNGAGTTANAVFATGTNGATINNPTAGTTLVTLTRGTEMATASRMQIRADVIDANGAASSVGRDVLVRAGVPMQLTIVTAASASAMTAAVDGPSRPSNLRSRPGAGTTQLLWVAPGSSSAAVAGYRVYASPTQSNAWIEIARLASTVTSYDAPYPAASSTTPEWSFVVLAVDALDRLSEVSGVVSNAVRDDVEALFNSKRGSPGSLVVSDATSLPNNIPVAVRVSNGELSVNGGVWTTSAQVIAPGDTVRLRGVAGSAFGDTSVVLLTAQTSATSFQIVTTAPGSCRKPRTTSPLGDSAVFVRYLQGYSGLPLVQRLLPTVEQTNTVAAERFNHFTANQAAYLFSGNAQPSAAIDGALYTRYALGLRGDALTTGLTSNLARTTSDVELALGDCQ